VPAPAVIPSPIVYFKVVVVKTLVVCLMPAGIQTRRPGKGTRDRYLVLLALCWHALRPSGRVRASKRVAFGGLGSGRADGLSELVARP